MTSLPYGVLTQTHPEYLGPLLEEIDDLYIGGYRIAGKAAAYLPRHIGEPVPRYQERLQHASYVNYLGQISDFFTANVFAKGLSVSPAIDDDATEAPEQDAFWEEFSDDVDRQESDLAKFLRPVLTTALLKRRAVVAGDFPRSKVAPLSRAEEDEFGLARGYLVAIDPAQLLDWDVAEDGSLLWAVLHRVVQRRASPAEARGSVVDEFKVWTQGDDGFAQWQIYRSAPRPSGKTPDAKDEIPLVDEGVTKFTRIPLRILEVPPGLWVGNKIGPLAKEHFRRRCALMAAENKSLFAIPVARLAAEIPAPGAPIAGAQEDPNRGNDPRQKFDAAGFMTIGADDSIEFAEPQGRAYEIVHNELEKLVDEMFRTVHQMAASIASTANAMGRSGDSKAEDRHSTEVVLSALGALVRDFAVSLYSMISDARGEDVTWVAHGLDKFDVDDRATVLAEAAQAPSASVSVPSVTFKQMYTTKLAGALLGSVDPQTWATIQQEILDGVSDAEAKAKAMRDAPPPPVLPPTAPFAQPTTPAPDGVEATAKDS